MFFLLLASGFHVDVGQALRSGRMSTLVGVIGVVVPVAIGAPLFAMVDPARRADQADGLSFALFAAVAVGGKVIAAWLGGLG